MAEWRFRTLAKSELNRGTTEEEFFRSGGSSVDSLVREAIQNSLDAGIKLPVRVRLYISGQAGACSPERLAPWVAGLGEHLVSALGEAERLGRAAQFITIEDFNTQGLCGSTTAARESDLVEKKDEHFYFFWRNIGITGKAASERGSWGLGKLVYPAASHCRAMFGLSVRATDQREYLMGLAGLGQHPLAHAWCDAFGFFGRFGADPEDGNFVLPVDDTARTTAFREAFGLKRVAEPGLSVVIPWPRDEEMVDARALDAFASSVLRQFAFPLAAGQLEVSVETPDRALLVSSATVQDAVEKVDWNGRESDRTRVRETIDLASWALHNQDKVRRLSRKDEAALGASWEDLVDAAGMDEMRDQFLANEAVGFEVPVLVRAKTGAREQSLFRVYLRQREHIKESMAAYVRQGLTITEVTGPTAAGLVALTVVEDPPLARVLRAAENPAHTRWNGRADRVKEQFIGGDIRVQLVASAPRELHRRLLGSEEEVDKVMLADIFPEPSEEGRKKPDEPKRRKGRKRPPPPDPPPPRPQAIRIERLEDGFVVVRTQSTALRSDTLQLDVALDCEGGDPFKAYEVFDFDLATLPIEVAVNGGEVIARRLNRIVSRVGTDFRLQVTGFDAKRDVVVRPRWLFSNESDEPEDATT